MKVVTKLALTTEVFAGRRDVHGEMSIDFEQRRSVSTCLQVSI